MVHSNIAIAQILSEMSSQIGEAHSIAKAADLCAKDGQVQRAFEIALDLEDLLHSANHLLQAAATLNRLRNSGSAKQNHDRDDQDQE